uniref:Odorant receptor n=1 Tax=Dendrolimus punctatus TaxID=238572 RepID=A0A2K8GKS0_9NEOP|nr:Odorant Receptor 11 [Dendrolimus punctatus]
MEIKLLDIITRSIRNTGLNLYEVPCSLHWLAKISIACFLGTYILQLIALVMAKDDSERLFECFSVISFCGMGILKLVSFRYSNKHWNFLLNQVSKLENEQINDDEDSIGIEYESDEEEENTVIFKRHIKEYTAKFNKTSSILSKIYWFTAFVFVVSPFVEYSLKRLRGFKDIDLPHVLPGWSPLDLNFVGYLLTVVCEIVAAIYCVFVHVAFDLTAVGIMTFSCGQYSLLRNYSELIGGRSMKLNICKKRDIRAHFRIKKCHRIHILLNRSISTLDSLLKTMLGVYFFVATLTLCSVALRLKTETMSVTELVTLLQYMCATLTQLFLYCSYGNYVLYESSVGVGQGPFCAAYWCLSPRLRRELLLLGICMMQTRRLHAGPFNSLDLPSFVQIVRAAYSYYAVLI